MDQQEFRKLIRKVIIQKTKPLNESFDDENDDLGIYSADFDPNEFGGEAMKAAMQDIGSEFEPLGKSKFEKDMSVDEFIADLQRQNLNLPKDKEELAGIEKMMNKKKTHEKKFGAGSLNETGEWSNDEEGQSWIDGLQNELEWVQNMLAPGIPFIVNDIKGFDKYQGPYANIHIDGDNYKVWTTEDNKLWIENFPIDNTSKKGLRPGFEGDAPQIAAAINTKYSILSPINMNEGYVNPDTKINRPKDAEGQPLTHRARVEDLETGSAGRVIRFGVDDGGKLTVHVDWIQNFGGQVPSTITYPDKIVVRDENRIVREEKTEGEAYPENNRYMFFSNLQQIQRQAGLMLEMNEEQVNEILENGHDWAQDHIATAKESMDQVFDFLMNETKKEVESEIDESAIRSHTNGRSQNLKPGNYPQTLKRVGLKENLDQALDVDDEVFFVIDNDFNRAHYRDLIGKTFDDAPGYAQVKLVKRNTVEIPKDSIEADFHNAVEVSEDFDYAAAEREHAGQEELSSLDDEAKKYVPEALQQFLVQHSFKISEVDGDTGSFEFSYDLKIPKQADETVQQLEKWLKEEAGEELNSLGSVGPGQAYRKASMFTVLEKATNNWIVSVHVKGGFDI